LSWSAVENMDFMNEAWLGNNPETALPGLHFSSNDV